jgi:phosphinothricin acetyltransferase
MWRGRFPPRTPAVEVRAGRPSDLEAIVEIYNHYVRSTPATLELEPVLPDSRRPWLDEHSGPGCHRLLVAVDGRGSVLGWATTSPFRPRAGYATTVESSVYCHPEARGVGVGTRLYASLFASVATEEIERIVAGVTLPNPASLALHTRFGFRHVGTFTRVGRKFDQFWDVAWFERALHGADGSETSSSGGRQSPLRARPGTPGPPANGV